MADLPTQLVNALADRYRLERELGRGGMATVYLAHDLRHKRSVALKVLLPELAQTLGPERFQREIETAARLQHPHILTVLDSGVAAGHLWFTMPFVEGESLRDRLRREAQLPVDDALRIATDAARALEHAHQHGVIHRDIKPENLLLTTDGSTLVADFGIAQALGKAGDRLTQTGLSVGTPAYMSPEQGAGDRHLNARTDIYSLGCVLYEMLVGQPPFTGPTPQAVIARRLSGEVPRVRLVRPSVPEHVEQAVTRALAPVAADRFPSAAEFARALQATVDGPTGTPTVPLAPTVPASSRGSTTPNGRARQRIPVAALALGLGVLLGLGMLFAWRRNRAGVGEAGGVRVLAVLPFENLGDSTSEYFADGITDAVRGKLSGLPGLQVIASRSSNEYKHSTKGLPVIARELGVGYLLIARIRWAKLPDGTSRVEVSPELVEVSPGSAPRTKWQQPFAAGITDVFKVQADIAGQVASAMNLALSSPEQQALAERPTANLAAYQAFLKGEAASQKSQGVAGPASLRRAIGFYEQAVALDSSFVAAWAGLSENSSLLYWHLSVAGAPRLEVADRARSAADRALALDPEHPDGYRALGDYYRLIPDTPDTPARAIEQYAKGLKLSPGDADLLRGLGLAEQSLGRWEQSVEHLRRSQSLDPRSVSTTAHLGQALLWLRRHAESLAALELALAMEPSSLSSIEGKAMNFLAQADLAQARATLARPPAGVDLPSFVAYMAAWWDLYWALSQEQRALLRRLTPAAFEGDAGAWGLALAGAYEVDGDMTRAAAYADSARAAFERDLAATPEDPHRLVLLGVALAYMGRRDEAVRAGKQGVALLPEGTYFRHQLARIYILVGEPDKALDQLEPLLKIPYYLSPGWLKIDPTFAPLRGNPRFERLVEGT